MNNKHNNGPLEHDIAIIVLSVIVSVILVKTGIIADFLNSTSQLEWLGSLIAGMFFTSAFTTAPAIVTLGEIAREGSLLPTVILGGIGAVVGDLIIFRFIKDKFAVHIMELLQHQGSAKRFKALLKIRSFKWLTFFVGGLIIASPLPDELGISLLGFSRMRTTLFITLSFVFNSLGILVIGLIARAI